MSHEDYFVKIQGIDGESQDSKHKNEIDVISWSWGATQPGTMAYGGGGGAGKVSYQDFHFQKRTDKASPNLLQACSDGRHIDEIKFTVRKAGKEQQEYLVITFTESIISSYSISGHGEAELQEQVSINFSKQKTEYKVQNKDGSLGGAVTSCWDVKQNKSC